MDQQYHLNLISGLLLLLLVGCAQPRPFDDLWVAPRPYRADMGAVGPPAGALENGSVPGAQRSADNPDGPITLRDAVALALRQNHALAGAGWAAAAAEADALQMARPRNPTASLGVENFAGPDAGDTFQRQTLRVSQVIELADKRDKRRQLGEATQRLRAWDYEQQRLEVASQTAARYLAVVVSQRRVALAQQQLELAEAGYAIADERVRNGVAPGLERDQAAVRVTLGRIALEQARQALSADRAGLAAMWGGDEPAFTEAAGELDARVPIPPLDELKRRAGGSPSIARWDDEIEQRRAVLDLERAKAVTDPSVGGGLRYFSDADEYAGVFEVSWPLAVLDDNRSAVLSARMQLARAGAMQEQVRVQTLAALARTHAQSQAAAFAITSLVDDALPAAQSAYEGALESYRAGQSDYLTVLDAERSLLDLRYQRLDAEQNYHRALIELEQITAHALEPGPAGEE